MTLPSEQAWRADRRHRCARRDAREAPSDTLSRHFRLLVASQARPPRHSCPRRYLAGKPGVQKVGTYVLDRTHAKLRMVFSPHPVVTPATPRANPG